MTAFHATFVGLQPIATRKVYKLVFEVPTESVNAALEVLGGVPDPANPAWVGIARLNPAQIAKSVDKPKERTPSQRAWALCQSGAFGRWLTDEEFPDANFIADALRKRLGIKSRGELDTDPEALAKFETLEREFHDASR